MDIFKMSKIENLNKVSKNIFKKQDITVMLLKLVLVEKNCDAKIFIFFRK
jgi:hypothetical protein